MPHFKEITCASACNKLKRKMPYTWDLNIYRGCEHGCQYCFAKYTHAYLETETEEFFDTIYVKMNIREQLEKLLSSPSWKREVINIGGITDSYQSAEARYKFMPDILKLLIKYKTPVIISTKSDLILRDYDLIAELADITYVNVASTITATDETVRRKLEPRGVESAKRFAMLAEFSKTNASIGLHDMPIVPYITDDEENIESLCAQAQKAHVSYMLTCTLYLRGATRKSFLRFIQTEYPHLSRQYAMLFGNAELYKSYKENLYRMVNRFRTKYAISSQWSKPMKEKLYREPPAQLSLF